MNETYKQVDQHLQFAVRNFEHAETSKIQLEKLEQLASGLSELAMAMQGLNEYLVTINTKIDNLKNS